MKFLLLFLFFILHSFAQESSPTEVLEKVRARYAQMNDASASFTQTVKIRFKQTGQSNSGTIKIKKGNKYSIETDQQTIVTDGKKVWLYTPATNQVIVDQFKANRQTLTPEKFLVGLPKDFSATKIEKENNLVVLSLAPTQSNTVTSHITALKVWTTPGEWIVEKIEYQDKNGTTTTIALSDILFNKGIDDKEFQFDTTDDMKIVNMKSLQ